MCDSTVEHNYRILCSLYLAYDNLISSMCSNSSTNDLCCVDDILCQIENYPITWDFYSQQRFKFSQSFEDLVIFNCGPNINKDG